MNNINFELLGNLTALIPKSFIISKEYEIDFFNNIVRAYCLFPILTFIYLWFFNANAFYGKFRSSGVTYFNFPGKLGWFIMELASPVTFLYSFLTPSPFDDNDESLIPSYTTTQKILASLYLIHYFNRTLIYTYRAPNVASIHLTTILSAVIFNVINGYSNGRWISVFGNYTEERCQEPLFILGVLIFFIGMWINIEHDNILFNLRKENTSKISSNEKSVIDSKLVDDFENNRKKTYFIPNEGLFNYVCCPNYLGEIIEWIGFAIACWYSLPALLFAIMTPANLFPRARKTFKWYNESFKEYPKNRKVIIPFVW